MALTKQEMYCVSICASCQEMGVPKTEEILDDEPQAEVAELTVVDGQVCEDTQSPVPVAGADDEPEEDYDNLTESGESDEDAENFEGKEEYAA